MGSATVSQALSGVLGREEEPLRKTFSRTITETRRVLVRRVAGRSSPAANQRRLVMCLISLPFIAALSTVFFSTASLDLDRRKNSVSAALTATQLELGRILLHYGDDPFDISTFLVARERAIGKTAPDGGAPSVSLISACKDRSSFLKKVLPSWQAALSPSDEIIIVDWSTDEDQLPIRHMTEVIGDPRIFVVTVQNQRSWILSRAFNLAAQFARGNVLLKVDCDTHLSLEFLPRHQMESHVFYRPQFSYARTTNEQHLNGVFMMARTDFNAIQGFDERLTTYGWDDSDLYERATDILGLTPRNIRFETLAHIEHSDLYRSAHQNRIDSPMLQTQFNSIGLKELPPWINESSPEIARARYSYRAASRLHGGFDLLAQSQTAHPGLETRLSPAQKGAILDSARNRILHDVYSLPWDILKHIEVERDELLNELQALYPRGWVQNAGSIFAELRGSEATRMLCLASSVALAKKFRRPLFVAWDHGDEKNGNTQLSDFFNPNLIGGPEGESNRVRSELVIFSIKKIGCSYDMERCGGSDNSYTRFVAYDNIADPFADNAIMRHLNGTSSDIDRRHMILRLGQPLTIVPKADVAQALVNLVPSLPLGEKISSFGDVAGSVALYLGDKLSNKTQLAIAKRFRAFSKRIKKVFVIGRDPEVVANVRLHLGSMALKPAREGANETSRTEKEQSLERVAELYAMGIMCKDVSRDGHIPSEVLELITTFESVRDEIQFQEKKA